MENNIAVLKLHSLKELLVLRNTVQTRMDDIRDKPAREHTIEYLTLGQILVRLPDPALLTPHVCKEQDIQQ